MLNFVAWMVLSGLAAEVNSEAAPKAKLIPLVQISGTSAPSGELKIAPSALVFIHDRLDLQISPIFKATTKEGSTQINLSQPADSGGWSMGGGLVFHILHPKTPEITCEKDPGQEHCEVISSALEMCDQVLDVRSEARCTTKLELWTDADRSYCELRPSLSPKDPDVIPSEKLCAAAKGETDMKRAMAKCDQALAVKPPFTCGKESGDKQDQEFCKVRAAQGKVAEAVGFEPESLCKLGRETYDAKPPSQAYDRRYPLAQFYLGALGGSKKYEFITLKGDTPSNESLPKRVLNAAVGATFIPGLGRFPLTIELAFLFRARPAASTTPIRWCQNKLMAASPTGDTVQSCADSVLGPPTDAKSYAASLLLGAVDAARERWRFSAGPEYAYNTSKTTHAFSLKVPISVRLTPGTGNSGYLGDYKGVLRITPSIGAEWNAQGDVQGTRVLLVLDLLGQQDLFGSALAGL